MKYTAEEIAEGKEKFNTHVLNAAKILCSEGNGNAEFCESIDYCSLFVTDNSGLDKYKYFLVYKGRSYSFEFNERYYLEYISRETQENKDIIHQILRAFQFGVDAGLGEKTLVGIDLMPKIRIIQSN